MKLQDDLAFADLDVSERSDIGTKVSDLLIFVGPITGTDLRTVVLYRTPKLHLSSIWHWYGV